METSHVCKGQGHFAFNPRACRQNREKNNTRYGSLGAHKLAEECHYYPFFFLFFSTSIS